MSGRAIRKALRQREAERWQARPPAEEASQSEGEHEAAPTKPSLFALLDDADDADEGDGDGIGEEDEQVDSEAQLAKLESKEPRKKKKKKKGKGKAQATENAKAVGEDDIDRALRELNTKARDASAPILAPFEANPGQMSLLSVLKIDFRNLNAQNEMKRLFGKDAMRPDDNEGETAGPRRDPRMWLPPGAAGGRALNKGRRNPFVQPKDEWPKADSGGLGMEIAGSDPVTGVTTYKFVHSQRYQSVQRQFQTCVESLDPQQMLTLLQFNPYHISTLLQCSEIFVHQRDFTAAGDLLERALFSLGRTLHSSFQRKLAEGSARLSFHHPENRDFFLCCWRYIKNLSQRGTWRTAEEYARLVLAMDPEDDPFMMCLIVDFLALKARQPERFLALTEHPTLRRQYSDLPNIAFSSALAQLQLGNESLATEYLSKAITRFPWIPAMLYQELGVSAQLSPALWGVQPPENSPRQQVLAGLYVERTKDLWKQPALTTFLVDTCSTIYNLPRKVPGSELTETLGRHLIPSDASSLTQSLVSLGRHVMLTDTPSLIRLLPSEIIELSTSSFDPLSPVDHVRNNGGDPAIPGPTAQETADGGDSLSELVMRMLPWFGVGEEGEIEGRRMDATERALYRSVRQQLEQAGYPEDVFRGLADQAFERERTEEQRQDGEADGEEPVDGERQPEGEER